MAKEKLLGHVGDAVVGGKCCQQLHSFVQCARVKEELARRRRGWPAHCQMRDRQARNDERDPDGQENFYGARQVPGKIDDQFLPPQIGERNEGGANEESPRFADDNVPPTLSTNQTNHEWRFPSRTVCQQVESTHKKKITNNHATGEKQQKKHPSQQQGFGGGRGGSFFSRCVRLLASSSPVYLHSPRSAFRGESKSCRYNQPARNSWRGIFADLFGSGRAGSKCCAASRWKSRTAKRSFFAALPARERRHCFTRWPVWNGRSRAQSNSKGKSFTTAARPGRRGCATRRWVLFSRDIFCCRN